ncbi:hypothetical protein L2E82_08304 [Cichorium intybus]|uniref:Uncharacterized protein n=1 Tax=Cichorium intybus TaxID=13427 RepID=A0ACB9G775_CICIN|nr:hypothetical protein L2E82_08304 [Cichorium intybus]
MEGDEHESLQQFSPEILIEDPSAKNVVSLLPHIYNFCIHSKTLPFNHILKFNCLRLVGHEMNYGHI